MAVYELHQGVLAIRKQNPTTGEVENISLHGSICRWRIAYHDSESRAKWTMQASYALASHFWDSCKGKDAMHYARSYQEQSSSSQQVALTESSNFKMARLLIYPAERCVAAIKEHVPANELAKDGRYAEPYFMICFYMAHIFLGVGNFEQSRWLFAEAKERMHLSSKIEDTVRLLRGFAICCQQTGDFNAAKKALKLALNIDSSLERRMDDDALEIISLLKTVRDRLATHAGHQKRALIAGLHPKRQPNQLLTQSEESGGESDKKAGLDLMAIALTRWAHQRERCQAIHPKMVADCTLWISRLRYLGDSIFRMDEETVQMLAGVEMELDQVLEKSEKILGLVHPDTVSLVNLLGEFSSAQTNWPKAAIMLKRESEALSKICDEEDPMKVLIDDILESTIATIKAAAADEIEFDDGHYMLARENYLSALRECGKENPLTRYVFDRLNYFSESGIYDNTLWAASLVGNEKVVQMLLDQGADINAQGEHGNALQVASLVGDKKLVQILLDRGADVNAQSRLYGSALQAASSEGQKKVVQMLLDRGADANAQGGIYGTALQVASLVGNKKVVQMLLDQGIDVNARGGIYSNALRAASYRGHQKVVRMLLDRGADVNAQGGLYESALRAASSQGHQTVVQMLLDRGADYDQSFRQRVVIATV